MAKFRAGRRATQDDESDRDLAGQRIGDADHGRVHHGRMLPQGLLDVSGRDFDAAIIDDIVGSAL